MHQQQICHHIQTDRILLQPSDNDLLNLIENIMEIIKPESIIRIILRGSQNDAKKDFLTTLSEELFRKNKKIIINSLE
jgi:hypothetical protein